MSAHMSSFSPMSAHGPILIHSLRYLVLTCFRDQIYPASGVVDSESEQKRWPHMLTSNSKLFCMLPAFILTPEHTNQLSRISEHH